MSHVIQVLLRCDAGGCEDGYVSDARAVGQARRWAAGAGWAVDLPDLRDARRRLDYCPVHRAERGYPAVA